MPPLRNTGQSPEAERPEYAGQYRLEACLGTGGMGVVHLAASDSGLRLAVKVIHAEHASDPEFRARFRQEVAAARRVSGAFTASVVDADPDAERPWMATLFIEGPTLSEQVKRKPLDGVALRRLGAGLAEALRDIHRAGVVHRDLKPSNVLLAPDGPKVIDFGISRPSDSDLRTETGKLIGTPPFMAPEQFQRPREVGPPADVFALGSVLVHAATGRGPFDSDSPYIVAYQVVHDEPDLTGVPGELVPLLRRCLEKEPERRPSPYEVMVALRAAEPSSGYDTQAHIPAPRTPDPVERVPAEPGGDGGERGGPSASPRAAERDFAGWSTVLRPGNGENRTPECTAAADVPGVFCAAPGLKATRLDSDTGKPSWSLPAGGGSTGGSDVAMPPVLAGGLLHVIAPDSGRLEALDPGSGAVRWDVPRSAYASVQYTGDLVVLTGRDGRARALDAAGGRERWSHRSGSVGTQWVGAQGDEAAGLPVLSWALSADGRSTRITAYDRDGGRWLWTERLTGNLRPAQLSGGVLHLLSTDRDQYTDAVVRLDVRNRTVRRLPLDAPVMQGQASVSGRTVLVSGSGTGSVVALDAESGEQRWRRETMASQLSRPVAAGNAVYVAAGDGRLLALDARSGKVTGQTRPRMDDGAHTYAPRLAAPVVMAGGRVFGTAPDGSVFGLDAGRAARW